MAKKPPGGKKRKTFTGRYISLNSVLSHWKICGGPNKPIQNSSFSETSTACKIHLYSPSGVVLISIRSIYMRSKALCTLIGSNGALVVRGCDFICAQVLQCFRTNVTSWRLMPKNCRFNAAKFGFLLAWIEFAWCSWTMRSKTSPSSIARCLKG